MFYYGIKVFVIEVECLMNYPNIVIYSFYSYYLFFIPILVNNINIGLLKIPAPHIIRCLKIYNERYQKLPKDDRKNFLAYHEIGLETSIVHLSIHPDIDNKSLSCPSKLRIQLTSRIPIHNRNRIVLLLKETHNFLHPNLRVYKGIEDKNYLRSSDLSNVCNYYGRGLVCKECSATLSTWKNDMFITVMSPDHQYYIRNLPTQDLSFILNAPIDNLACNLQKNEIFIMSESRLMASPQITPPPKGTMHSTIPQTIPSIPSHNLRIRELGDLYSPHDRRVRMSSYNGTTHKNITVTSTTNTTTNNNIRYTLNIALYFDVYALMGYHLMGDREKALQYILITLNMVAATFLHPTLGVKIFLSITRIYLLSKWPPEIPGSRGSQSNYLNEFCSYQRGLKIDKFTNLENWDMAIMYTGLDLWGDNSSAQRGVAYINGVCGTASPCALVEAAPQHGYDVTFTVAHEMAHNLGVIHDDEIKNRSDCHFGNYIMNPRGGKKLYWSACSREAMIRYCKINLCLHKPFPTANTTYGGNKAYDAYGYPFPGLNISMDEQCQMEYGLGTFRHVPRGTIKSSNNESCNNLGCEWHTHDPFRNYVSYVGTPLQGSYCGPGRMWCVNDSCIPIPDNIYVPRAVDGGWTTWMLYQPCSNPCYPGSRDAEVWIRTCTNPVPVYGGKPCAGGENIPVLMVRTFCSLTKAQPCHKILSLDNFSPNFCPNTRQRRPYLSDKRIFDMDKCILYCAMNESYIWNSSKSAWTENLPMGIPCGPFKTGLCIHKACLSNLSDVSELNPMLKDPLKIFYRHGFTYRPNLDGHLSTFYNYSQDSNQVTKSLDPADSNELLEGDEPNLPGINKLYILIGCIVFVSVLAAIFGHLLWIKRKRDTDSGIYDESWNWWRYSNPYRPQSQVEEPANTETEYTDYNEYSEQPSIES